MNIPFFQTSKLWLPSYLAQNLEKVLNAKTSQERVRSIRDVYSLLVRTITITVVSQYLFQENRSIHDDNLNSMLANKLPDLTMDAWLQLLFASVKAFGNQPGGLFIQEIYDLYWDTTSRSSHVYKTDEEDLLIHLGQMVSVIRDDGSALNTDVDWDKLERESSELLSIILKKFCFLQDYELIRVLAAGSDFREVEVYKGMKVSLSKISKTDVGLQEGWFYWQHVGTNEFLRLNPFLVFWQDVVAGKDVAVYQGYVHERLQYLLTLLGKTVVDKTGLKEFEKLMNEIIWEARGKPRDVEKLEWDLLLKVGTRVSQSGMGRTKHKYSPDLYLQREQTCELFWRYLASKKKIFILVGKTGSGKSSFILSLGNVLSKNDNICTIMYEGSLLNVDPSIQNVFAKDFNDWVIVGGQKTNDLWEEIGRVKGIENRQVILFVDAINENTNPQVLLQQLDMLARVTGPWLKIVLTCRPETLQIIRYGVGLDQTLYYQEKDGREVQAEQQLFSYSDNLDPFSRDELQTVYEKYKAKYNLKSELAELPGKVKDILQDPFNLWLVSLTYLAREIPKGLTVSDLVKVYLESLKTNLILKDDDINFLKNRLVPLFFGLDGKAAFELSRDMIQKAGGSELLDSIRSLKLSDKGERKNKSYIKLADADILAMVNENSDWKIKFTHDRFFEYFVGERILELGTSQDDQSEYFQNLITQTKQSPFLWGAVKHALVMESGESSLKTPLMLCYTDEQRVKEMMVEVLIDFGFDNLPKTEEILGQLLPPSKRAGFLKRIQRLLGNTNPTFDISIRNSQKIAIEVASKLNLIQVLQTGTIQKDPAVRTSAVRHAYYLWQREPAQVLKILRQISEDAFPDIIPNMDAVESLIAFSLVIFIDHFKDEDVLQELQNIWSGNFIAKIFMRDESAGFIKRRLNTFVRERIFFNSIKLVMTLIREFPQYAKAVNYSFIDAFFRLGEEEKELYKNLVGYLDLNGDYSAEQMKDDYLAAIKTQCLLFQGAVVLGLGVHARQDPDGLLPFLRRFFEGAKKDAPTNIWVASIPTVLMSVLDNNPNHNDYFGFFLEAAGTCQTFYKIHTPEAYYLGPYVLYQYLRTHDVRTDWLVKRIDAQLEAKNVDFFNALVDSELVIVGIERQQPLAALEVLAIFFNRESITSEIRQIILTYLTRLRIHYPDEVDYFLEKQNAPDDFCLSVRANEPAETVGALIGRTKVWNFILNALTESSGFQKHLIHLFTKAADFKETKFWLEYIIRYLLNLVYGQ